MANRNVQEALDLAEDGEAHARQNNVNEANTNFSLASVYAMVAVAEELEKLRNIVEDEE